MSVSSKMNIPKTISVGYRERNDTYTKKLAYVIYTDGKGVLRKEASWQSWRDHKIEPSKFDNVPTSGFVLNKKAGGYKSGWDVRNTYVRVYDPRDFEFEISVPNLLFILQETSAIKGKGLEGEFIYAWHGTELVLLPTSAAEYKECLKFTDYQVCQVKKGDIIEGHSYMMKDMTEVMYLGKHLYGPKSWRRDYEPIGPRHIFVTLKTSEHGPVYLPLTGFNKIAAKTSEEVLPQYAEAYDTYKKSKYCFSEMVDVKIVKKQIKKPAHPDEHYYSDIALQKDGDKFYSVRIRKFNEYPKTSAEEKFEIVQGDEFVPAIKNGFCEFKDPPYHSPHNHYSNKNLVNLNVVTAGDLFAREFYSAVITTKNGLELDLIKNNYY